MGLLFQLPLCKKARGNGLCHVLVFRRPCFSVILKASISFALRGGTIHGISHIVLPKHV